MTKAIARLARGCEAFEPTSDGGGGGTFKSIVRFSRGTETNEKSSIACAWPFSVIVKSSFMRSVTTRSRLSVTMTSTATYCVLERKVGVAGRG